MKDDQDDDSLLDCGHSAIAFELEIGTDIPHGFKNGSTSQDQSFSETRPIRHFQQDVMTVYN